VAGTLAVVGLESSAFRRCKPGLRITDGVGYTAVPHGCSTCEARGGSDQGLDWSRPCAALRGARIAQRQAEAAPPSKPAGREDGYLGG